MQDDDANVDADPATSEGIFVFTSSAPPVAAAFTARVQVTGTVSEFVPSSDPLQPPSTQLTFADGGAARAGRPAASDADSAHGARSPIPPARLDQLERVEHMRVSVASLTVTGPSGGSVDESAATGTSDGLFHGVVTGVARPFREAGIQAPDPAPSGSIPPIPRWDSNPERIGVDERGDRRSARPRREIGRHRRTARRSARLRVAHLHHPSRWHEPPSITPGTLTTTVSSAAGNEVTVASVNLRRFFDTIDDPSVAESVLTPAAYDRRLAKASIAIRDHLRNPDIIGVQEVEKLGVLTDLAARILADGGPTTTRILVEGNDAAGLDVGFLVKTDAVPGGVPRVSSAAARRSTPRTLWIDPATGAPALLHDRPPLVLEATVNRTSAVSFPIVVIVTDLLGLTGIDSVDGPWG